MLLDTTFLVDLQREVSKGRSGGASALLEDTTREEFAIGFVSVMEFAEGYGEDGRDACDRFLANFRVLWPDAETAWRASRLSRALRHAGRTIGDHDAWIAALALQYEKPVVTRNAKHFRRVDGLRVIAY